MSWRTVLDNLGSALLSLTVGFVVWVAAVVERNPGQDRTFAGVPVVVEGTSPRFAIHTMSQDGVSVTVRGPASGIGSVEAENLEVVADVSGLPQKDGLYNVGLSARCTVCRNKGVVIMRVEPSHVELGLSPGATRRLPVVVSAELPEGYQLKARSEPLAVDVAGPRSRVEAVARAVADLGRLPTGMGARRVVNVQVTLLDAEGRRVDDVTVEPAAVEVEVDVARQPGFAELVVDPKLRGGPSPGFFISGIDANPRTVTVRGPPDLIGQLPGSVETEPVDISGEVQTVKRRAPIRVPQGVEVVNAPIGVTVTVEIRAVEDSRRIVVRVRATNLRADLTATVSPESVAVLLTGPQAELERVAADDVNVVVDLTGVDTPRTFKLRPTVNLPPDSRLRQETVPKEVDVTILRK
jgi:YbbR domain-containing protein